MRHTIDEDYLELFRAAHGAQIAASLAVSDPRDFRGQVPEEWIALACSLDPGALRSIWSAAGTCFDRFVNYLSSGVQGCGILAVGEVPVLVLALPDWDEQGADLSPGFCLMGPPTPESSVEAFAAQVGALPLTMQALWKVTSYLTLKEGSTLCTLDSRLLSLTESPANLGNMRDPNGAPSVIECLEVAVVNREMVTCLTRMPGTSRWEDHLVRCFRSTREVASAVRMTLASKLADWTFHDYSPADAEAKIYI